MTASVGNNDSHMAPRLSDKKLAVLGAGKLGGILLRAYLKQGLFHAKNVTATVKHGEKAAAMSKELGVAVTNENRKAVKGADIVLLGVKPQVIAEVLKEIKAEVSEKTLIISVAASVPTSYLEQYLGAKVPVIRAMPNTPAAVGCGMTGICKGAHAGTEHLEIARSMFEAVGRSGGGGRKKYGCRDGTFCERAGVCVHYSGIAGGGGSESGFAARCCHAAGGANYEGFRKRGARNRRSSCAAEGRGDNSGGLHHRRNFGAGRRQTPRDAD